MIGTDNVVNEANMPTSISSSSIPEFVKKLFGMLEENSYPQIFSWGTGGETFVVKDPNEFSRHILPKHFKHSNFASFVRQLNKYDFHKLRIPEDDQRIYGDQAWEFQHPSFKYNRRDLLEDIKRKPTGKSVSQASATAAATAESNAKSTASTSVTKNGLEHEMRTLTATLQKEVNELRDSQKKMTDKLQDFDSRYKTVLDNMNGFKKTMQDQDVIVKEIMSFASRQSFADQDLNQVINTYNNISANGEAQFNRLSETVVGDSSISNAATQQQQLQQTSLPLQQDDTYALTIPNTISRKRKRASQPGWTVPPRVLLVDDDSIFRRLSTKLLQFAGCKIDVAVDGVEAIKKLGLGKYDLVLMDIMMPKLDGMSATRNIRQYDTWTPIISMTSNTTDKDIQQYILSGMTDVLPKPFNQGTLGSLLERYCAHLVVTRQQQQQLHLLQQNYSLNGTLLNMPPQLTLIEDNNISAATVDNSSSNATAKGREKVDNNMLTIVPAMNRFNSNSDDGSSSSSSNSGGGSGGITSNSSNIMPSTSTSGSQQQQPMMYSNNNNPLNIVNIPQMQQQPQPQPHPQSSQHDQQQQWYLYNANQQNITKADNPLQQ